MNADRMRGERAIKGCITRLVDSNRESHGCGVLVDDRHVVTCAHVVAAASSGSVVENQPNRPTQRVCLTFPFINDATVLQAKIVVWKPVCAAPDIAEVEDIAVLRLSVEDIAALQSKNTAIPRPTPQALVLADAWSDVPFLAYGFADASLRDGDWVPGQFGGEGTTHSVQMHSKHGKGLRISGGFSGGPVWDGTRRGIGGIVVEEDDRDSDTQIGYMISGRTLQSAWQQLPIAAAESEALRDYQSQLQRIIDGRDSPCPEANPRFELNLTTRGDRQTVDVLRVGFSKSGDQRILIAGTAGAGKSTVVGNITRECLVPGSRFVPIFVAFKGGWSQQLSKDLISASERKETLDRSILLQLEILLQASLTRLTAARLQIVCKGKRQLIIADGINEVGGDEARKQLLTLLDNYARQNPKHYVIVTDRTRHQELSKDWMQFRLNPVADEERRRQYSQVLGQTASKRPYDSLSDIDKKLYEVPFFLNLALSSKHMHLGSQSNALRTYFKAQLGLDDKTIDKLAGAAFEAYCTERSTSINSQCFERAIGKEVLAKLSDAGVIVRQPGLRKRIRFYHQLQQDYLAARHLARTPKELRRDAWNRRSFDALTFETVSPPPLIMTLEQLNTTADGDEFLERVYDWNWWLAVDCLAGSIADEGKRFTSETRTALMAVVAEKQLDRIEGSREGSRRTLGAFRERESEQFLNPTDPSDLVSVVRKVKSEVSWFLEWRTLFSLLPERTTLSEPVVASVAHRNSILGWTAANVVRRFRDADECRLTQLRGLYQGAQAEEPWSEAVRWRVVHALGVYPSRDNIQFLCDAVDEDRYSWVVYGAARSLMELAAQTAGQRLCERIVGFLTGRLERLEGKTRGEILAAAFYRGARPSWLQSATPLLRAVVRTQSDPETRRRWRKDLTRFQSGKWDRK